MKTVKAFYITSFFVFFLFTRFFSFFDVTVNCYAMKLKLNFKVISSYNSIYDMHSCGYDVMMGFCNHYIAWHQKFSVMMRFLLFTSSNLILTPNVQYLQVALTMAFYESTSSSSWWCPNECIKFCETKQESEELSQIFFCVLCWISLLSLSLFNYLIIFIATCCFHVYKADSALFCER